MMFNEVTIRLVKHKKLRGVPIEFGVLNSIFFIEDVRAEARGTELSFWKRKTQNSYFTVPIRNGLNTDPFAVWGLKNIWLRDRKVLVRNS